MTIMVNEYQRCEIEGNMVNLFELMGERWVPLGPTECWSDELIAELIEGSDEFQ